MKREFFMDNVLKNDESVKFCTGLPTLTCFMAIINILKPYNNSLSSVLRFCRVFYRPDALK